MGQKRVKWGDIERYCGRTLGFEIRDSGGEKIVIGPNVRGGNKRHTVRIGHTSSRNAGSEVLRCYVSALKRVFGISIDDLLSK